MTMINHYKRKCNYCRKIIDIDYSVSIIKGEKHSCHTCAGKIIKEAEQNKIKKDRIFCFKCDNEIIPSENLYDDYSSICICPSCGELNSVERE